MNEDKQANHSIMGGMTTRQMAREVLKQEIAAGKQTVRSLETLEKSINWNLLSEEQEQSLWSFFIRRR